jgi:hypothetical protein
MIFTDRFEAIDAMCPWGHEIHDVGPKLCLEGVHDETD